MASNTIDPASSIADSSSSNASQKTSPPKFLSLSRRQPSLLRTTDHLLLRLSTVLSTPGGIDNALCTLGYTLVFVHARITAQLERRLHNLAASIAKNASHQLLPGETLIATVEVPPSRAVSRLRAIAVSSKALSSVISDYRIFVRMWGLLGMYTWARDTYLSPPADGVVRTIVWAQIAANVLFQYLENVAYLASHNVIPGVPQARQNRLWALSSRFWCADVLLSLVKLMRERQLWKTDDALAGSRGDEKEHKIQQRQREVAWLKQLVVNLAYAPMTLHWSIEEGVFSETLIGAMGMIAGGVKLRERWRAAGSS